MAGNDGDWHMILPSKHLQQAIAANAEASASDGNYYIQPDSEAEKVAKKMRIDD